MSCRPYREQMMASLQAELTASEQSVLAEHLRDCHRCRIELDKLREVLGLVDQHRDLEPSMDFDAGYQQKLAQSLADESQPPQHESIWASWLRWRLPALTGAAVAAAALLIMVSTSRQPRPERHPQPLGGDIAMMEHLDLLAEYDVVANLDGLEEIDLVINLDTLLDEVTQ